MKRLSSVNFGEDEDVAAEVVKQVLFTFVQTLKDILANLDAVASVQMNQPCQESQTTVTLMSNITEKSGSDIEGKHHEGLLGQASFKSIYPRKHVEHIVDKCNGEVHECDGEVETIINDTAHGQYEGMDISEGNEHKLGEMKATEMDDSQVASLIDPSKMDPRLVQIKASKAEIERRISAFIERKKNEVNDMNKREFCPLFTDEHCEESCARTDAVFIPRTGSKSHVKVSRVVNAFGPQTVPGYATSNIPNTAQSAQIKTAPKDTTWATEERLKTIESHLDLGTNSISSKDTFSRLKTIENRILYLESLSPEYFTSLPKPPKRQRPDQTSFMQVGDARPHYNSLTVEEIDSKMKSLRERLMTQK